MADKDEYSFTVTDPYDTFLGYGDVKITSTFASSEPERRGISLLIIHGDEKDGWRAEKPKAKFLMINMPFKTLVVKRLAMKKKTVLGVYMEEAAKARTHRRYCSGTGRSTGIRSWDRRWSRQDRMQISDCRFLISDF